MKCHRQIWNYLQVIMIRKVSFIHAALTHNNFNFFVGEVSSDRSELIAYQPSPFNNSLDLNELLSNCGNSESLVQGKIPKQNLDN